MLWIVLALLSHFFWGLGNVADKYFLENKIKNPYVYLVWMVLLGLMALIVIPFVDFYIPSLDLMIWLVVAGALYFYGGLPYVRAVQIEEVTRINVWWGLIPVFAMIIEWLILGRTFTISELVAFGILLIGAVVASVHLIKNTARLSKAAPLMAMATLAFAIYAVIFSYVTQAVPFMVGFVWISIIMAICSLTLFFFQSFRTAFVQEVKNIKRGTGAILVLVAMIERVGGLFNQWALSLSAAALVFAFEGSQIIFVFLMVFLISLFQPKAMREELDFRNVLLKIVAMILMVVGIVVLALG
jgi:uncharacterized membrane protein